MTDTAAPTRTSPAIRKAAILITTLDTRSADALLDKMTAEQAALVRQAVMELDDIRPGEQDAVIREFMGGEQTTLDEEDGVELDLSLARQLHSSEGYHDPRGAGEPQSPPFLGLFQAGVPAVVRQLEQQHPQVIALVIAHLPPERAADVVQRLRPRLQADVLRRIAELDAADAEVVREVERGLEHLLSGEIQSARVRQAGLTTVAAIVNAAGAHRAGLLGNLSQHHQEFADQLEEVAQPSASSAGDGTLAWRALIRPASPVAPSATVLSATVAPSAPVRRHTAAESARMTTGRRFVDDPPADPRAVPQRIADVHAVSGDNPEAARDQDAPSSPSAATTLPVERRRTSDAPLAADQPRVPVDPATAPAVTFDELADLRDDEWAVLVRAVEPSVLLLALAGAGETLVKRITGRLSWRESRALRRQIERIGPVQLADIDRAQEHVVAQAEQLAAMGRLRLPRRRQFAAAA